MPRELRQLAERRGKSHPLRCEIKCSTTERRSEHAEEGGEWVSALVGTDVVRRRSGATVVGATGLSPGSARAEVAEAEEHPAVFKAVALAGPA